MSSDFKAKIITFSRSAISGMWVVHIMRQVIVTGGNVAESCFLLATLWVIINAVAHTLITWILPVSAIELLNYLSVISFSALPELIIIPIIVLCYAHWSVAIKQKSITSGVWATLYSLPTLVFLGMTVITIAMFVSTKGTHFVEMNGWQLVVRCLSGWFYASINMLFAKIGEPHYASQLEDYQQAIEAMEVKIEAQRYDFARENETTVVRLTAEVDKRTQEIEQYKNVLAQVKNDFAHASNDNAKSSESALEAYSEEFLTRLSDGAKTISVADLTRLSGHSKRKIDAAIKRGQLQVTSRNKELVLIASLIPWLRTTPSPASKNEEDLQVFIPFPVEVVASNGNGHHKKGA